MAADIALRPGNVQGFNNEIQIAGSEAAIDYNPGINESELINGGSKGEAIFQGKAASPAGTVHSAP